ncbi:hypothetical protein [Streptomyces sp. NPDC001903]|uniref:hypothetical protein n=1 Tax=Streptomyces sp. NPDC001903 TaxID=3364622 RepID=UPI00367D25BE
MTTMNSRDEGPFDASSDLTLQAASKFLALQKATADDAMDEARKQQGRRLNRPIFEARRKVRRSEVWFIGGLALVAAVAYAIAYVTLRGLIARVPEQGFQISDTAQVITAVSTLTTAVAAGIAAILKAYALLMEARADVIRARAGLPPANEPSAQPAEGDPPLF